MKHITNRLNQWLVMVLFTVLVIVPAAELKAEYSNDTYITITNPNSGTFWLQNNNVTITWTKRGIQNTKVVIYLYKGNVQILTIAKNTANNGVYKWRIPSTLANALYTIYITTLHGNVNGNSAEFSIVTSLIQVIRPAAGTVWTTGWGITHNINWTKKGALQDANVKIELLKGTTVESTLAKNTPNSGKFVWRNPEAQEGIYKIRITTKDKLVWGESGLFTLIAQSSVHLLLPNGNERLKPTVSQAIRWTNNPEVLEVKLEFSRDNGGSFTTIANHVPNTGSYDWLVPVNFTRNAIVRVSDSNGKPWINDMLLEYSFKFNYGGEGEEPGAAFWFGGSDPRVPGYGFAKIEIGRDQVQFGGFTRTIEPLAGAWHELRVRFNFRRDTAEILLDDQILFENAALNSTQEHYFQPNLVLHSGSNVPINFTMDDLTINIVQLDGAGNEQQLFNVLKDNFDRYDEKDNALQNCWQWQNMNDKRNKVELNVENRDNKSLRLLTETGKQLVINLPFNLPGRIPFDISDKNMVIDIQ